MIALLAGVLLSSPASAGVHIVARIERVEVRLVPDLANGTFRGTAELTVSAPEGGADAVEVDASGLELLSASEENGLAECVIERTNPPLIAFPTPLHPPRTRKIRVEYRGGAAASGLTFIREESAFWSRDAADGGGRWFPGPVDPGARVAASVEVAAPAGVVAITNRTGDAPIPASLIAAYAGRYARVELSSGPVPVSAFVPPGREAAARAAFGRSPEILAFLADAFGAPYPWPEYSQTAVRRPVDDGLENAAAARFDRAVLAQGAGADELVAHELAHQWFGAWASPRDPADAWFDEGAAAWYGASWLARAEGPDAFAWSLEEKARASFAASRRAPRPLTGAGTRLDAITYGRGAWLFQALRARIGEKAFTASVRRYFRENGGKRASVAEFRRAVEAETGKPFGGFFFMRARAVLHPRLHATLTYDEASKELAVVAVQEQVREGGPAYALSVPLRLDDGSTVVLETDAERKTASWPVKARPRWVAVDPEQTELLEVARSWPEDMLIAELSSSPSSVSRARSARDLAESGSPAAVAALEAALAKDRFWGVSVAAAESLGAGSAVAGLASVARRPEARVRRAVAAALGRSSSRSPEADESLRALAGDPDDLVSLEAVRSLAARGAPDAGPRLRARLATVADDDAARFAVLEDLAAGGDSAARSELEKAASNPEDAWLRRAGKTALERLPLRRRRP